MPCSCVSFCELQSLFSSPIDYAISLEDLLGSKTLATEVISNDKLCMSKYPLGIILRARRERVRRDYYMSSSGTFVVRIYHYCVIRVIRGIRNRAYIQF